MSDSSARSATNAPPAATLSIHGDFLEQAMPQWLVDAPSSRRQALKSASVTVPAWYKNASSAQRQVLDASFKASAIAQVQLDKTLSTFKAVEAFAAPLLRSALKQQFKVEVDVNTTFLGLRRPLKISVAQVEIDSFEFLRLSMLNAALHNFEAWECEEGAYHSTSGFVRESPTPGTFETVTVDLTVSQFLSVCRSLDIGAQYQAYLKSFFAAADASADAPLRQHFIASQKAAMKAAAEQAVLSGDIEPEDRTMILSVIDGEVHPWMGDKQVWFRDMGLMKKRMTGCVAFVICEKYRYNDEVILYVPHDPAHPLKRYTSAQMHTEFKRLFTARDGLQPDDPSPTAYQRFFSQFVPYAQRGYYFSQFTQEAAGSPSDPLRSPWLKIIEIISGAEPFLRIKELPPELPAKREPAKDPYIAPAYTTLKGKGIWADNVDLWTYLYEQHRDKIFADASAHAVPAADVDAQARAAKLAHLMEFGLLGLNLVSMLVPVLGEIMMGVMAGQLLYETLEGSIEWAEGDKRAAKAHMLDVAENLALIAVMAGVGTAAGKLIAVRPEPVIERLSPVTLPNGKSRLWKPDLSGYESAVSLDAHAAPNALGQYTLNGKTYFRQGNTLYEQFFDASIKQWRIAHPSDVDAYQPILHHNGRGAWRHTLERPQEWDRLTLLRRMGHETEAFSDTELITLAQVSGVSDNALLKMHVDLAATPPELADALRMYKADADAAQVLEQLRGTQPIDSRYLYALPMAVEMPGWPQARVLEIFESPGLTGTSIKYGAKRLPRGAKAKAPIKVSRADVLGGHLPARIVAALDEQEVIGLLGGEGARVNELRAQELSKQLTAYADTRKPAIFESLYLGTEPVSPQVRLLQRTCPGLSEAGAEEVLAHASADHLKQLEATHRVPLTLLEEARWYARQGRQARAYAGLRSENMASADSRRLALHSLAKLPGWPHTLRLEVREGTSTGPLLDSIGSESAAQKKYLVETGPRFQAFNERGESLNSVPLEGDNFYASLMHALPDEARRGLGVTEVGQSRQLQDKIIESAELYRSETARLLAPQSQWFKPPARVNSKLLGYYASGRAAGHISQLPSWVQHVYPGLNPEQVTAFLRQMRSEGRSERDIFTLLQTRMREFREFEAALSGWVGSRAEALEPWSRTPNNLAFNSKVIVAQSLKALWQRSPAGVEGMGGESLSLVIDEPLPLLTCDFPQVRELSVVGRGLNDANAEAFLAGFANVEALLIRADRPALANLPLSVGRLPRLKRLTFRMDVTSVSKDLSARLNALTSLEELHIGCSGIATTALDNLDLSALVQLKKLSFQAPYAMSRWPAYVEHMPLLERLDLKKTRISKLPEHLYVGHEQLWSGLSLDWSNFTREAFKPAYEYVKSYPGAGHLADLHQMVSGYAEGELNFLMGPSHETTALHKKIMATWDTPQTRFNAVEALSVEYSGLFEGFYKTPGSIGTRSPSTTLRQLTKPAVHVFNTLTVCWRQAVELRYGVRAEVVDFELPTVEFQEENPRLQVDAVPLPQLPAGSFSQVRALRLGWKGESVEQTRGFLRAFSGTQHARLNNLGLTELPMGPGDFPGLVRLDLSNNRLQVTPVAQAQLNGLKSLELLDLSYNPLETLDVSALTQLQALNVQATQLEAWPTGAELLPKLTWLDLRYNQISGLPPDALANDELLLKVNLAGNSFTSQGEAALKVARQRVETAQGLPEGALAKFEMEPVTVVFPPKQTALTMTLNLLPLTREAPGLAGPAGFAQRLQGVSLLTDEQALERIEQLRSAGLSDSHIDTQLSEWHRDYETLTRQLNGWLHTRAFFGSERWRGLEQHKRVAVKVRECWQGGLSTGGGTELSLSGLKVFNLPELQVQFTHVGSLDLTGMGFSTAGVNRFLNSFANLKTLVLSGNELAALPEAVERMSQLERLELAANALGDPEPLYRLQSRDKLRWLDLSHNNLDVFSTRAFHQLETLDLNFNGLTQWPDGALEATALRRLNLSGSDFTTFAQRLLDGSHDNLIAGTDLSDCYELTLESLQQLRLYSDSHQGGDVMGLTRHDLDQRIAAHESGSETESVSETESNADAGVSDDEGAGYQPLEIILDPHGDTGETALASWLENTADDLATSRREGWWQLSQAPGHEPFFHLLSQLRHTQEFLYTRADLTRRVWEVIDAAVYSQQQREPLFVASQTHSTCIDGRTLTFSAMEVLVFEEQVLRDVPAHNLRLKGQRLLQLSRQLFRLDQVDTLAEANAQGLDRAEERLRYRIGMTRGWPDGLELPGQPTHMAFGRPISGQTLARARAQVLAAEASDTFYESLIARDYWLGYLRERNPQAFELLEQNAAARQDALEEEHSAREPGTQSQERYEVALNLLEIELGSARAQKLIELSRNEVLALSAGAADTSATTPGSPQPGPSWRQ
jgi:Leucine-rich repeat (LRR) protein